MKQFEVKPEEAGAILCALFPPPPDRDAIASRSVNTVRHPRGSYI